MSRTDIVDHDWLVREHVVELCGHAVGAVCDFKSGNEGVIDREIKDTVAVVVEHVGIQRSGTVQTTVTVIQTRRSSPPDSDLPPSPKSNPTLFFRVDLTALIAIHSLFSPPSSPGGCEACFLSGARRYYGMHKFVNSLLSSLACNLGMLLSWPVLHT